jgi:hypothetical protein
MSNIIQLSGWGTPIQSNKNLAKTMIIIAIRRVIIIDISFYTYNANGIPGNKKGYNKSLHPFANRAIAKPVDGAIFNSVQVLFDHLLPVRLPILQIHEAR